MKSERHLEKLETPTESSHRQHTRTASRLALASSLMILGVGVTACDESPSKANNTITETTEVRDHPYGTGVETTYVYYSDGSAKRTIEINQHNKGLDYVSSDHTTLMICEPTRPGHDLIEITMEEVHRAVDHIICADGQITENDFVNQTPR